MNIYDLILWIELVWVPGGFGVPVLDAPRPAMSSFMDFKVASVASLKAWLGGATRHSNETRIPLVSSNMARQKFHGFFL